MHNPWEKPFVYGLFVLALFYSLATSVNDLFAEEPNIGPGGREWTPELIAKNETVSLNQHLTLKYKTKDLPITEFQADYNGCATTGKNTNFLAVVNEYGKTEVIDGPTRETEYSPLEAKVLESFQLLGWTREGPLITWRIFHEPEAEEVIGVQLFTLLEQHPLSCSNSDELVLDRE